MNTAYDNDINGPLQVYWREIKHFQPLDQKAEAALVRRVRQGDEVALQELVTANLRFVVRVASELAESSLPLGELVAEGNLGLLEAVNRFDERRGHKFITYAVWWIRQAMYRALAEQKRLVRPPFNQKHDLRKIEQQRGQLTQQLGRVPTLDELASSSGISRTRTRKALQAGQRDFNLDAPLQPDEDQSLSAYFEDDEISPEEHYDQADLADKLSGYLNKLETRQAQVLRWYFGLDGHEPMTLERIGALLGLTRERVRQLRDQALNALRRQHGKVLGIFCQ
ncbi:MAG: sigma-70 family RNA polymerase sigma factor [Candidatus Latescibacteria bacterium]|nr:sigma-70 family RNA polymerase sigma factor [Candidatus Latescibacterota bacterium]